MKVEEILMVIIGILSLIIFYKIFKGSLVEGQLGSSCWTKGMTPNVLHFSTCPKKGCGCVQDVDYYPCDLTWDPSTWFGPCSRKIDSGTCQCD